MTAPQGPRTDEESPTASREHAAEDAPRDRTRDIEDAWRRERPDLDPASVRVVTRVWHLAALFSADRRRLLDARGLDSALLDLLGTLRRAGSPYALSTRELAERSRVTPAAISQRLTRAERRGWVTREPAGR
ncbi:MarR family transcriptional regulator, partial [Cellulomonas cellasea]